LEEIRMLEERVIILNYKAIEKLAKGNQVDIAVEPGPSKPYPGSLEFSFGPSEEIQEPDNQISLIDSIKEIKETEEVKQEDETSRAVKEEIPETPEVIARPEKVEKLTEKVEKKANNASKDAEPRAQTRKNDAVKGTEPLGQTKASKKSINDKVKGKAKQSLAQKHRSKSIDSIGKSLSVNARIGMVKELYKGDSDSFNAFVNALDEATNADAAQSLLDKTLKELSWKEKGNSVTRLRDLIKRKHKA